MTRASAPLSRNDRRAEPGTSDQGSNRPAVPEVTPKRRGVPHNLKSSGSSRTRLQERQRPSGTLKSNGGGWASQVKLLARGGDHRIDHRLQNLPSVSGCKASRLGCVLGSCIRLAGGSPATVVTKQPCSWWPARGEIQSAEASRQRPLGGRASKRSVASIESCSVVSDPAWAGNRGSRAVPRAAKAMDGVKSLESQPQGTLRRMGIGTFAQPNTEEERSVCAPALGGRRLASLRCPVSGEADKCSPRNGQARSGSQRR